MGFVAALVAAYAALVLFFLWAVNGSTDYPGGPVLDTGPAAVLGSIATALLVMVTVIAVGSPVRRERYSWLARALAAALLLGGVLIAKLTTLM